MKELFSLKPLPLCLLAFFITTKELNVNNLCLFTTIPKEADNEQFCLAVAANRMAKEGWEPVNLDSRRILFRRQLMDANGASIT
jgi:hypothetical protein